MKKEKQRDKSSENPANKTTILSGGIEPKKHPARDKNCMIELRELKKQVDNEIRREARAGKLELTKRPDDSMINKSLSQGK